ncbi:MULTISPECIES: hypothetical protein [Citrobacter freundii complex]|uniref:hypothetical protein n=1 Tax=Citrobacter freundii complex TaxID=1344959 RepID=UPI00254A3AF8|nr:MULTISPECIES: hypothetical protein [Citrobacter freundii complex]WQO12476.1 hypothetical protein U0540_11015 [Citrobacter freundii]
MEINQLKQIIDEVKKIEDKTYTPYENLVYVLKALHDGSVHMKNVTGTPKGKQ